MLFDTHAHMNDEAFDADREEMILGLPEKGCAGIKGLSITCAGDDNELCGNCNFAFCDRVPAQDSWQGWQCRAFPAECCACAGRNGAADDCACC